MSRLFHLRNTRRQEAALRAMFDSHGSDQLVPGWLAGLADVLSRLDQVADDADTLNARIQALLSEHASP